MATRSKVLAAGASPIVLTAVYTTPAGETTLVKDVRLSNSSTTTAYTYRVAVNRPGVGTVDLLRGTLAAEANVALMPWVAMHPGDTLQLVMGNALIRHWISGAELEGVTD